MKRPSTFVFRRLPQSDRRFTVAKRVRPPCGGGLRNYASPTPRQANPLGLLYSLVNRRKAAITLHVPTVTMKTWSIKTEIRARAVSVLVNSPTLVPQIIEE